MVNPHDIGDISPLKNYLVLLRVRVDRQRTKSETCSTPNRNSCPFRCRFFNSVAEPRTRISD